jgi:hypothetical protein
MALTKSDKEWVVKTIKEIVSGIVNPIDRCLDNLRVSMFGQNGNNGLNGKQKEMEIKLNSMEEAVITITEQVKQIRSTAIFWTRLVGGSALAAIVAIVLKLLLHQ